MEAPLRRSKPFLRWAGSKRQLLPTLAEYWGQSYRRYVEPFMGSACLFFYLRPAHALLSDINGGLVETFAAVRDYPGPVYRRLTGFPLGEKAFYHIRAMKQQMLNPIDRAARFIYLNRFCFNGLYRTNQAGQFNVPYSPAKTGRLLDWSQFSACSRELQSVDVRRGDFQEILIEEIQAGDFVYLDPPYAQANQRISFQYGPQSFGINDIERLRSTVEEIDRRGGHFVLSYAYCNEAIEAFRKWESELVSTYRNIAGFSIHRGRAMELIFSNTPRASSLETVN